MNNSNKQEFISAYIVAALWSSTDDDGEPLDNGDCELSDDARYRLSDYAAQVFDAEKELIEQFIKETGTDYTQAGHSFWLSCNGHGAGLFDFTSSPAALALDAKCDKYGHYGAIYKGFDLYVGDDELIYVC